MYNNKYYIIILFIFFIQQISNAQIDSSTYNKVELSGYFILYDEDVSSTDHKSRMQRLLFWCDSLDDDMYKNNQKFEAILFDGNIPSQKFILVNDPRPAMAYRGYLLTSCNRTEVTPLEYIYLSNNFDNALMKLKNDIDNSQTIFGYERIRYFEDIPCCKIKISVKKLKITTIYMPWKDTIKFSQREGIWLPIYNQSAINRYIPYPK